jgi:hypothetical protein
LCGKSKLLDVSSPEWLVSEGIPTLSISFENENENENENEDEG